MSKLLDPSVTDSKTTNHEMSLSSAITVFDLASLGIQFQCLREKRLAICEGMVTL